MFALASVGFILIAALSLLFFLSFTDAETRTNRRMAWTGVVVVFVLVMFIFAVFFGRGLGLSNATFVGDVLALTVIAITLGFGLARSA